MRLTIQFLPPSAIRLLKQVGNADLLVNPTITITLANDASHAEVGRMRLLTQGERKISLYLSEEMEFLER